MSTASLAVGLVSGVGIGAVGTAVLTTSHERAERFRERMLDAAEAFLVAVEQAETGAETLSDRFSDYRDNEVALTSLAKRIDELSEGGENPVPDVLVPVMPLVGRAMTIMNEASSEEGTEEVAGLRGELRAFSVSLADYRGEDEEIVRNSAELLEEVRRLLGMLRGLDIAREQVVTDVGVVANRLPRLRVVFALGGHDDPATKHAFAIGHAAARMAKAVVEEHEVLKDLDGADAEDDQRRRSEAKQALASARAELHQGVGSFAAEVSRRIRKRWGV